MTHDQTSSENEQNFDATVQKIRSMVVASSNVVAMPGVTVAGQGAAPENNCYRYPSILERLKKQFREFEKRPANLVTGAIEAREIITTDEELEVIFNSLRPDQIEGKSPRLRLANRAPASPLIAEGIDEEMAEGNWLRGGYERERFICRPFFARGRITGTAAPGGVGKSGIALYEAASIVCGRDPYSDNRIEPVRVLYWNLEDTKDASVRRLSAFLKADPGRFDGATLERDLILFGAEKGAFKLAFTERGEVVIPEDQVRHFIELLKRHRIGLVVLDPLVSLHTVEENDNGAMDRLMKDGLAVIAREADCAVHVVHHSGKGLNNGSDPIEFFRGASSVTSALRMARSVKRLSGGEATAARVAVDDGEEVLKLEVGKNNIAGPRETYPRYLISKDVLLEGDWRDMDRVTDMALSHTRPEPAVEFQLDNPTLTVRRIVDEGEFTAVGNRSATWLGKGILAVSGLELGVDYKVHPKGHIQHIAPVHVEQINRIIAEAEAAGALRIVNKRGRNGNSYDQYETVNQHLDGSGCNERQSQPWD